MGPEQESNQEEMGAQGVESQELSPKVAFYEEEARTVLEEDQRRAEEWRFDTITSKVQKIASGELKSGIGFREDFLQSMQGKSFNEIAIALADRGETDYTIAALELSDLSSEEKASLLREAYQKAIDHMKEAIQRNETSHEGFGESTWAGIDYYGIQTTLIKRTEHAEEAVKKLG